MQVAAVESPADSDVESTERRLLEAAASQSLTYVLIVEIPRVEMIPMDRDCNSWTVRVPMEIGLWSVVDRKLVLRTQSTPSVRSQLDNLKVLFDEPGALRTRFVIDFGVAAENVIYAQRFELPQ